MWQLWLHYNFKPFKWIIKMEHGIIIFKSQKILIIPCGKIWLKNVLTFMHASIMDDHDYFNNKLVLFKFYYVVKWQLTIWLFISCKWLLVTNVVCWSKDKYIYVDHIHDYPCEMCLCHEEWSFVIRCRMWLHLCN
jgi:hypothetical protein